MGDRSNQPTYVTGPLFLPPDLTKPIDWNVHLRLVSSLTRATFDTFQNTESLSMCMSVVANKLCSLLSGILTLQPTSQAKTKAAGLTRHQLAMMALGVPAISLGTLAIVRRKALHESPHFTTWHGVSHRSRCISIRHGPPTAGSTASTPLDFDVVVLPVSPKADALTAHSCQTLGIVAVAWLVIQVVVGGGSVWFGGRLFGGNPKAKLVWKYHRYVMRGSHPNPRGFLQF